MLYVKKNVKVSEYKMHNHIYQLGIVNCPKIISYDKKNKILTMEKIDNMCLSDFYGKSANNIPSNIFSEIKQIIKKLYDNNIEYTDITGYNSIEHENKIWIIDFEHSKIKKRKFDQFIHDFLKDDTQMWNKDFE